jgi:phage gp45-like
MSVRTTLAQTRRTAGMTLSRATIREVNDDNLIQEVKQADVFYSESPTNFERWQPVGMTAVPVKQQADTQPKNTNTQNFPAEEDWNHDQPTGPAAEAVMLYIGGSRSHPIAMVDDRRVRPYGMSEGEGAHYAPDGSEQMVLFKDNGTYVVSLDGKSVKNPKGNSTRFASLRHVNKSMQTHKIDSQQQQGASSNSTAPQVQQRDTAPSSGQQSQQKYKHEGDSVNTEVRASKNRIEFYNGDKLVGWYDKGSNVWTFQEVGGNLKLIIDGGKIIGQYQDSKKSFRVDDKHAHICYMGNSIWVDKDGCWSSGAINLKPDNCT